MSTLTPHQIAEGREAAKREYDAKMAFYAAAETLNRVLRGPDKNDLFETRARVPAPVAPPLPIAPTFMGTVNTQQAFASLDLLKDKILLALHFADGALPPSAILARLQEAGAVPAEYPASHLSPKLAAYRDDTLIEGVFGGWIITPSGRERVREALKTKGLNV